MKLLRSLAALLCLLPSLALAGASLPPAARQSLPEGLRADGVADLTSYVQGLINRFSGGEVWLPCGRIRTTAPIYIPDNTRVRGCGVGASTIVNATTQVFRNAGYSGGTPNIGITVEELSFDGSGTGDTPISMVSITKSAFRRLSIANIRSDNVTVGIGISAKPGVPTSNVTFADISMDVPDYGIVLDSGSVTDGSGNTTYGAITDVTITNLRCTTHWGSCISLAKDVRNVAISGGVFHMPGDDVQRPQVGIGVKTWSGIDATRAPSDIAVTGSVFIGATSRTSIAGVSAANFTNNLTMTGNTFRALNYAFYNNFAGTGATNIIFANNTVRASDNGVFADTSQDSHIAINSNVFTDLTADGVNVSVNFSTVNGNTFTNVAGKGIRAQIANDSTIATNVFTNIGQEAIFIVRSGGTNSLSVISSNLLEGIATSANNTYAAIQLNDQPHIVSGNAIRNTALTGNLPSWIIGRASTAGNTIFSNNWMYGARQGYYSTAPVSSDVNSGNIQRGGIGL